MKYVAEIKSFAEAHQEVVSLIKNVTEDRALIAHFDQWNLKDVIAHMAGWNECMVINIDCIAKGTEAPYYGSVDEFNKVSTAKMNGLTWHQVLVRFKKSGGDVVQAYERLADDLFEQKFWPTKSSTPLKFLKILTNHYLEEHLPEIREKTL